MRQRSLLVAMGIILMGVAVPGGALAKLPKVPKIQTHVTVGQADIFNQTQSISEHVYLVAHTGINYTVPVGEMVIRTGTVPNPLVWSIVCERTHKTSWGFEVVLATQVDGNGVSHTLFIEDWNKDVDRAEDVQGTGISFCPDFTWTPGHFPLPPVNGDFHTT